MYKPIAQIHTDYDGQWVFMINCNDDEYGSIIGGDVVLHSENRENVVRGMEKYRFEKSMSLLRYAGRIPEGVSVIL
jgi:hypothetical protein